LFLFYFCILAVVDLAGIGLLGPYIGIAMDPSKIAEIGFLSLIMENLNINFSPISFISICMILIFSFRFGLAILVNKKILFFCRDIQVALRSDLMKTYQSMSYEEFTENDSSDAIANTTVLSMYFTNNVLYSTLKAFAEVILAIFLFSFLLFINGLLVLILVLGLGSLVTLYSNFFKSRMISYGQKINTANSNLVQSVKQSMEGIKEVRVLGKENFFYKRYISNAEIYGDLHASSQLINTGSRYFIEFAIIGFFVFTISASDFLMLGDSSDIFATLGMFAFAAIRLLPGVNVLSSAILQLRSQKNTVDRLYETLIDLGIEIDFSKIETDAYQENSNSEVNFKSISLENIKYSYPNTNKNILDGINLEIYKGESIGIIGPSGSGKTTLIDILLGLLKPKSGKIKLNGKSLDKVIENLGKMIAYIPQESLMINETLSSNIQLDESSDLDINNEQLYKSISQAQLTKVVDNLPKGVLTNIGESGIRLSGGQRQRVALARAIFHSRNILVFDEATSALDSQTESEVINEITRMKGIKTMIIVAHRTETLRFCDRIYKIDNGIIVENGTPNEILGSSD
jgi:ABC-type multidrug transport system fused ATPase/permease subunit